MNIRKILIVFKTHLDIGFTDYVSAVARKYRDVFIPNAMETAKVLREKGGEAQFKWTTGSWLIYDYLRRNPGAEGDALREAIRNGDIHWHGLPFTTHTELMRKELFQYGLSLSARLDAEFGQKTIAAKMTDVPGHTKAMIPLLAKAGIELLHIGVNPASAVPDVPEIFRWQADTGEQITVIYNGEYGNFTPLGNSGVALYFAHTLDNLGGQSPEQVEELFRDLRQQFPDAELAAADLNDVALALREATDDFPVITDEIGDSWIHGVGTDPKKISQFRTLQHICANMEPEEAADQETLAAGLMMIPEHTWGLDEKTHLHDNEHYSRAEFEPLRHEPNYLKMLLSWREQRAFMYEAIDKLSDKNKQKALKEIMGAVRSPLGPEDMEPVEPGTVIREKCFAVRFDAQGAIDYMTLGDKQFADENHKLCVLLYEKFCYDNYVTFHKRYHRIEDDWAWQDFTKPGMEKASAEYTAYTPKATIQRRGNVFVVRYTFPEEAHTLYGAPEFMDLRIQLQEENVSFDLAWFGKPANRIAEAFWFGMNPMAQDLRIRKLGTWIDPQHVVSRGNRNLHATDYGVDYKEITIQCLDSALVSPQKPCVLDYPNEIPNKTDGIYFGLYNNLWGTNFPMWYDDDARFRFLLKVKEDQ